MAFMQTMFKAYVKAKKTGKSKKCKKHDYDSRDSSNSECETGYGNTSFSVDKRLKIEKKQLGSVYLSTEARPIKVANTAPNNIIKDDEIAIETAKTGNVTAVVAAISIFCKMKCKSRNTNPGNEKPSR
jgi:hypothetical protein